MPAKTSANSKLYCPNPVCPNHQLGVEECSGGTNFQKFQPFGSYPRKLCVERVRRFRCTNCRTTFCSKLASIDYRNQKRGLSRKVFRMFCDGLSNRQIARNLNVNESLVRQRLKRLSQQSLIAHSIKTRRKPIEEVISYDGVENFAKSQYEPNYINQAIGMNSYFIYDFNFSPLNRKGRMSDRQKLNKARLEESLGRFPSEAIRISTRTIFLRLHSKCSTRLCIASDEHFQYRQVVQHDLPRLNVKIDHHTISAKAPRTFRHILFAVNHTDALLRQQVKAFFRETISFSKTHAAMIQKYALFMAWKNYFRPQFTKKQKRNPNSNIQSPAMAIGLESKLLRFRDFFGTRRVLTQVQMNSEWRDYFNGTVRNLREVI